MGKAVPKSCKVVNLFPLWKFDLGKSVKMQKDALGYKDNLMSSKMFCGIKRLGDFGRNYSQKF